jgi:hypothetical protein
MGPLENVKVTIVPALSASYRDKDGTVRHLNSKNNGLLTVRVDEGDRESVRAWLREWARQHDWRNTPAALELRRWYRKKTQEQLGLFWSLVTIYALDEEGRRDKETVQSYYHGFLELYAPRVRAVMPDGRQIESIKTMSEMNTVEVNQMIEGAFRELAAKGLNMEENAAAIRSYYIEWRDWRGRLRKDGLDDTYRTLEEYRQRIPFCEATLQYLQQGEGHLAHIVSKGSGGQDEPWNMLHLSPEVHIGLQHTQGWVEMLKRFPHLVWKVNAARKRHGLPPIEKPEDLYDEAVGGPPEAVREKRRAWLNPETKEWRVSASDPGGGFAQAMVVDDDEELSRTLSDLVSTGRMDPHVAGQIAKDNGVEISAKHIELF